MAYIRTVWENGVTPINAGNLNNIEEGINEAKTEVRPLEAGGTNANNASEARTNILENKPLSIEEGGTNANNAAEALKALGGISKKLIWSNPAESSSFPAQNLSIDLNDYDEVELELKNSTTVAHTTKVKIRKGTSKRYTELANVTGNNYMQAFSRATTVSSDSISFTDAHLKKVATATDVEVNNIYLIPIRIYGVKGVQ